MKKFIEKVLIILPIPVFLITLSIGAFHIPVDKIVDILIYKINGYTIFNKVLDRESITVLFNVRLPRVILSMLVGAALSVSGASFQALLRNPLVDPYILGLSSGAAFGAALSLYFMAIPTQLSAFIFGCISVGACYILSRSRGEISVVALILSGVIISSIFTALLSILQIMMDPLKLQGIIYWTMGSFHTSNWSKVFSCLPLITMGILAIYILRWRINILALGDREAKVLGVNHERNKVFIIIAATLLASSSVAVSGIISLVGLMVPHIVRMIIGPDNTKVIPVSICLGASYIAIVDTLSRSLFTFEVPIGIFTTLLGAPFFIVLLRKTRAGGWN